MNAVISKINDVCQRLMDNTQLNMIPPPSPEEKKIPRYAITSVKNTRKKMEDRTIIIDDLNGAFGKEVNEI